MDRISTLAVTALLSVLLLALGTTGYMLIEGWGLIDSLYMTVITLATVGYGEVHEVSQPGRVFTVILIVL
ncbi:MAG: potassium channel family protein, partial [Desulfobacteraceae bacterium]